MFEKCSLSDDESFGEIKSWTTNVQKNIDILILFCYKNSSVLIGVDVLLVIMADEKKRKIFSSEVQTRNKWSLIFVKTLVTIKPFLKLMALFC